jgi:LysM repeat protein
MKEDPELQMDDDSPDDRTDSLKRRRIGSDRDRLLPAIIIVLLVVIFAGGIIYFFTRRSTQGDATLQSKIASFEEKIMGLEKQIVDLQGKSAAGAPDPSLLHRVDALSQKVEALEKRSEPTTELKTKPSPPKLPVKDQKRYHTVQKGETLYKISKKYGITVTELRKLNGLSESQSVRTGQKLLISAGR